MNSWQIETHKSRAETEAFLARYEPWRVAIEFSNGAKSGTFQAIEPFNRSPLSKLDLVEKFIPTLAFADRVLDIGFNCGYNSIEVHRRYGAKVVAVDYDPRHLKVAEWIAAAAGITDDIEFRTGDAESFEERESFTVILHFGTLYHLPNPFRSIQNCANSLKRNGWLAVETTAFVGHGCENNLSKFIYGFKGDHTNYWALSKKTLEEFMKIAGLTDIRLIKETNPPYAGEDLSRVIYVARKA